MWAGAGATFFVGGLGGVIGLLVAGQEGWFLDLLFGTCIAVASVGFYLMFAFADRRLPVPGSLIKPVARVVTVGLLLGCITTGGVVGHVVMTKPSSMSKPSGPAGIAVNTVPQDPIGGALVYPVPGGRPSDYLAGGVTLYIDCLQEVKPNYLFARISAGPYKYHWIDVFDIKTPDGQDVRSLRLALRTCGPAITLPS